jgi:hypothetical protein
MKRERGERERGKCHRDKTSVPKMSSKIRNTFLSMVLLPCCYNLDIKKLL